MLHMNKRDEKKCMLVMFIKLNIIFHNISARKTYSNAYFLIDNILMFVQCNHLIFIMK